MNRNARPGLSAVGLIVVVGVAFVVGANWQSIAPAHAEVQEGAPPAAFLSGAARTEPVLREIASTLKRIDERLERIERVALKMSEPGPGESAPVSSR